MESHKRLKPFFSQAADRLNDRIKGLIDTRLFENHDHRHDQSNEKHEVPVQNIDGITIHDHENRPTEQSASPGKRGRAVTLEALGNRRSPHQAYNVQPKYQGLRPVQTHTAKKRLS